MMILLLLLCSFLIADGHYNGAPVCGQTPGHGVYTDNSQLEYVISAPVNYTVGEVVAFNITLTSVQAKYFKGFFVGIYDQSGTVPLGNFIGLDDSVYAKPSVCSPPTSGATHNFNQEKTLVSFSWMPPNLGASSFRIRSTFVHDVNVYTIVESILHQVTLPQVPFAAAAPVLTFIGPNSATTSWFVPINKGTPILSYILTLSTGSSSTNFTSPALLTYGFASLTAATSYSLSISSCNAYGCGNYSPPLLFSTPTVGTLPPAPGSAPSLSDITSTSVNVAWMASTTTIQNGYTITSYQVDIMALNVTHAQYISYNTLLNTTTIINGLLPSKFYQVRVSANSLLGLGSSSVVQFQTPGLSPCLPGCELNGICSASVCYCNVGFTGSACELKLQILTFSPYYAQMSWAIDTSAQLIWFEVTAQTLGWFAIMIGASDGKMTGGDAYVASVDNFGVPHLQEMYSGGFFLPSVTLNQPSIISNLAGYANITHSTIVFSRPLTSDVLNVAQITNANTKVGMALSIDGSSLLQYHGAKNRFVSTVNFFMGVQDTSIYITIHIVCILLAWGFCIPLSFIITYRAKLQNDEAPYGYLNMPDSKCAKYSHIALNTVALILTLIGVLVLVAQNPTSLSTPHGATGILVTVLTVILGATGGTALARKFDSIHKLIGHALLWFVFLIVIPMGLSKSNATFTPFILWVVWIFLFGIIQTIQLLVKRMSLSNDEALLKSPSEPKKGFQFSGIIIALNKILKGSFYVLGESIGHSPYTALGIMVVFWAFFASGFLFLKMNGNIVAMFLPVSGVRAVTDANYFSANFASVLNSHITFIVSPKDKGGNVLTKDNLVELLKLQTYIETMSVPTVDVLGVTHNYKLTDVCTALYETAGCEITAPTSWWNGNAFELMNDTNIYNTIQFTEAYTSAYGSAIARSDVFSGMQYDSNGKLIGATYMKFSYSLLNYVSDDWQEAALAVLEKWPNDKYNVVYDAGVSSNDEINKMINDDIPYFIYCYICMFVLSMLSTGRSHPILSRLTIGLVGMLNIILSMVAGFGFAAFLGFQFTSVHIILPFVILGVGLDDLYIICSWIDPRPGDDRAVILGNALSNAIPAIFMTRAADVVAFLSGVTSNLPIIASFSFYAASAIVFAFIFQFTFLAVFLTWDIQRIIDNKVDVLGIKLPYNKYADNLRRKQEHDNEGILYTIYSNTLISKTGKIITILLFAALLGVLGYYSSFIGVGQDGNDIYSDSSYILKYYAVDDVAYPSNYETCLLITEAGEYDSPLIQGAIMDMASKWPKLTVNGVEPTAHFTGLTNWLETFLGWAGKNISPDCFTPVPVNGAPMNVLKQECFYPALQSFLGQPIVGDIFSKLLTFSRDFDTCMKSSPFACKLTGTLIMGGVPSGLNGAGMINFISTANTFLDSYGSQGIVMTTYSGSHLVAALGQILLPGFIDNTILSVITVTIIGMITLVRPGATFLIGCLLVVIDVETMAVMSFMKIKLDAVGFMILVISVGLAFDYLAYLVHAFLMEGGADVEERMKKAYMHMGKTVLKGSLTTFLSIFFLFGAGSTTFRSMFVIFATVIALSILHGFILVPCIVTLMPSFFQPLEGLDSAQIIKDVALVRRKSTLSTQRIDDNRKGTNAGAKVSSEIQMNSIITKNKELNSSDDKAVGPAETNNINVGVANLQNFEEVDSKTSNFSKLCHCVHLCLLIAMAAVFILSNIKSTSNGPAIIADNALSLQIKANPLSNFDDVLNITMANFPVPTATTTYQCQSFTLPTDSVRHVTAFAPLIQEGHVSVVHHMLIYICMKKQNVAQFECSKMPDGCQSILASWAVGSPIFEHPPQAGFRIGRSSDMVQAVLQMHYNNVNNVGGLVDSSGVSLTVTQKLRPFDAGLLVVGAYLPLVVLPPGIPQYFIKQSCSVSDINTFLGGQSSVSVYAYGVHAHLLGRSIWSTQWRNNSPIDTLGMNLNYDFAFQHFVKYDESDYRTIQSGDSISNFCGYDTTSRASVTYGGEASNNEMCLDFLMYFPKPNAVKLDSGLGWCLSGIEAIPPVNTVAAANNITSILYL